MKTGKDIFLWGEIGSEQFQILLQWQFFCGGTSDFEEIVSWSSRLSDKRGGGKQPESKWAMTED